jgi:transcriptional accessory protein Tex/SPT6
MSDNPIHVAKIARENKLLANQVRAVRALLADDATVPFIARYRKEATGSLDEVQITAIRDRLEQLEELDQRREAIIKSLGGRNLLTEELGRTVGSITADALDPRARSRTRLLQFAAPHRSFFAKPLPALS